jgi:hypothetical protein
MKCYAVHSTVYLRTGVQSARLASGCKSELLRKGPVVAQSEALSWHLPAVTGRTNREPNAEQVVSADIRYRRLPNSCCVFSGCGESERLVDTQFNCKYAE